MNKTPRRTPIATTPPPAIKVRASRAIPINTIRIDITRVDDRWMLRGSGIRPQAYGRGNAERTRGRSWWKVLCEAVGGQELMGDSRGGLLVECDGGVHLADRRQRQQG